VQQRPAARACADDYDIEMVVHDRIGSGREGKPYKQKLLAVYFNAC
jgi:hypothetical protein